MLFNNECHHPEENYLFSMEIDGEQCDVWVVEDACKLNCATAMKITSIVAVGIVP